MVKTKARKYIKICLYIYNELLHVSTNHMAIFRDVIQNGAHTKLINAKQAKTVPSHNIPEDGHMPCRNM